MYKLNIILVLLLILSGCKEAENETLKTGPWLAQLDVMDNEVLPFNFQLVQNDSVISMIIRNAEEEIEVDEIVLSNDSILIKMPVFEGYISGTYTENSIQGSFIKESLSRVVPFHASYGESPRFEKNAASENNISGVWEMDFSANTEDHYIAKGIFVQNDDEVHGTIRTTTGDYRYLDGTISGNIMSLSTFDGAHAFLFKAIVSDSTLNGTFYSGNHFKEPFEAKRNESFELPDANSLTYLKEGYDQFAFNFPDETGQMISLNNTRYKDKVVIVQIMGTWCPNCLDETKFLVNYMDNNDTNQLEVVALAFEYAKTEELAFKSISRLRDRIGVTYPILLAQYGTSNKQKANEKLPMLNHVLSYPTTIYLDKKGQVRNIHTGFNGPATGEKYMAFKEDFDKKVKELLEE